MNLLFLDAYFEPEAIAYTHLEKDLIQGLIEKNNNIQIICPVPTRGITDSVREEYKNRKNDISSFIFILSKRKSDRKEER